MDIDDTIGRLSQNQHCSGGRNGRRKIELQISNTILQVDTQVGTYDSEADLKFAARVFNPITLDNVTVYNTRRIAFTHYQNGGVRIVEPIQLPSVQTCNVNQRTVPGKFKLIKGMRMITITLLTLSNLFHRSAKALQQHPHRKLRRGGLSGGQGQISDDRRPAAYLCLIRKAIGGPQRGLAHGHHTSRNPSRPSRSWTTSLNIKLQAYPPLASFYSMATPPIRLTCYIIKRIKSPFCDRATAVMHSGDTFDADVGVSEERDRISPTTNYWRTRVRGGREGVNRCKTVHGDLAARYFA